MVQQEGPGVLFRGLKPAFAFQIAVNGTRLGGCRTGAEGHRRGCAWLHRTALLRCVQRAEPPEGARRTPPPLATPRHLHPAQKVAAGHARRARPGRLPHQPAGGRGRGLRGRRARHAVPARQDAHAGAAGGAPAARGPSRTGLVQYVAARRSVAAARAWQPCRRCRRQRGVHVCVLGLARQPRPTLGPAPTLGARRRRPRARRRAC